MQPDMMTTGPDGYELIRHYEQCKLRAYPDPGTGGAPWTIGWGDTEDVRPGMVITQAEADTCLCRRLRFEFEPAVRAAVQVPLTQRQFDAVISTVYNTGPGTRGRDGILQLSSGRPSTFLRKLNAGDYDGAAAELPKWIRANGRVLKGLQRRREAERRVFCGATAGEAIAAAERMYP